MKNPVAHAVIRLVLIFLFQNSWANGSDGPTPTMGPLSVELSPLLCGLLMLPAKPSFRLDTETRSDPEFSNVRLLKNNVHTSRANRHERRTASRYATLRSGSDEFVIFVDRLGNRSVMGLDGLIVNRAGERKALVSFKTIQEDTLLLRRIIDQAIKKATDALNAETLLRTTFHVEPGRRASIERVRAKKDFQNSLNILERTAQIFANLDAKPPQVRIVLDLHDSRFSLSDVAKTESEYIKEKIGFPISQVSFIKNGEELSFP